MPLPIVNHRLYDLTIPSTKQQVKFRPFLVKEHKILLEAIEMQASDALINAIGAIVESCVTPNVSVDTLTMYDMDYIFLQIRAKSLGELVPVEYKCINKIDKVIPPIDENSESTTEIVECGTKVIVNLDLTNVEIYYPELYEDKRVIMITDSIGIKMKAPSFSQFKQLDKVENVSTLFDVTETFIFACIECIFDGDNISTPGSDFSLNELKTFLDELPTPCIEKINAFFDEMPYSALKMDIKCPKCKNHDTIELRELEDFFV